MCGATMAVTLGKNLRPPAPNWSDDYASRKMGIGGMGILRANKFFSLDTVRDN